MSTGAYIGSNNSAKKIKNIYIGVSNVARKVKKAYIGVGGIAKKFYTNGEIGKYGVASSLSVSRYELKGSSNSAYSIFAGGYYAIDSVRTVSSDVDAYNKTLTKTPVPSLTYGRHYHAGSFVGQYVVFGGGYSGSEYYSSVEAYSTSLTKTQATNMSVARGNLSAGNVGTYVVFQGGTKPTYAALSDADIYNSSLTKIEISPYVFRAMSSHSSAHIGNYLIFGGGFRASSTINTYISAIDTSLTVSQPCRGISTYNCGTASNDMYAIFAGGCTSGVQSSSIYSTSDIFYLNSSLSYSEMTGGLSEKSQQLAGVSLGKCALFCGGMHDNIVTAFSNSFDNNMVRKIEENLSQARRSLAASTIGDYALFCGGSTTGSGILGKSNIVDVYDV